MFRVVSGGVTLAVIFAAFLFRVSPSSLLVSCTVLISENLLAWIPWSQIMETCFALSFKESHALWKSAASSIRGQESYFSPAGNCMACKHMLYEGAHYCTDCGLVTSLVFDGTWCHQCGRISPKGSYYCAYCCFEFSYVGISTPPAIRVATLRVETVPHAVVK